jgi:hypothetical protein
MRLLGGVRLINPLDYTSPRNTANAIRKRIAENTRYSAMKSQ